MLTPLDIQNKSFKGGIGFDKRDVEIFMSILSSDYEKLYRANVELKDKNSVLNESLHHYRSIEDSMQKAMALSEKTSEDTIHAANERAREITEQAEERAEVILKDAKQELNNIKGEIYRLQQQYKLFKENLTRTLENELKVINSDEIESINLGSDFEPSTYNEPSSSWTASDTNTLGVGLGGGYIGNNPSSGFERANQEPMFDRGTLDVDPFANPNGGRFSHQTGGVYNGSERKSSLKEEKTSLNIRTADPTKRRRTFMANPGSDTTSLKEQQPKESTISSVNPTATVSNTNTESASGASRLREVISEERQTVENHVSVSPKEVAPAPQAVSEPKETGANESHLRAVVSEERQDSEARTLNAVNNDLVSSENVPEEKKPEPLQVGDRSHIHEVSSNEQPKQESVVSFEENKPNEVKPQEPAFDKNKVREIFTKPEQQEEEQYTGDVEDRATHAALDSEDNYDNGFKFEEETFEVEEIDLASGEVEDRVDKSTMLDSEDNYDSGFDFIDSDERVTPFRQNTDEKEEDEVSEEAEETYSGEVEDKVNESTMLDSEDNYDDSGLNFVSGNEAEEEEIPTILTSF